ncbi:unnamed protein product [Ranitomeya imitator]|uniref:Immunoglobulin V-set domain-containing protein n=1 Tax=Ranitomeya imitator TaxID=111125 RepID=A0ABN9KS25_9NEOB|nr:unnamed protein product [Ranitomeya imitator]
MGVRKQPQKPTFLNSKCPGSFLERPNQDSCAQIALIQSPKFITVSPGETVTISCNAISNVANGYLHWYQQKPGQHPILLFHEDAGGQEEQQEDPGTPTVQTSRK